ncbi:MAG TPA: protein kinase [Gemmataceae bacterium]|jgi:WD40 repeat protein/tRNA A-37 threonylcarbamoyl transferase component Bud32
MNDNRSTVDHSLPPSVLRRIDAICERFEDAWQAGQRPCIGDYLGEAEDLERDRLLRELIGLDIDYRKQLGEKPEARDYREYASSLDGRWLERLTGASRYELAGQIGRGGMGDVLQGYDRHLRRDLAVKMLHPELQDQPHMIRRFLREAWIGARLQHPGIVPVYDLGEFADRQPYFTMKLVRGHTLETLLKERGNPTAELPRLLTIFEQVCQTVAYAHAQGVIHRDLKPANIMVGAFGEVQVMDWGLAKVLGGAWGDGTVAGRDAGASARTMETTDPGLKTQAGQAMGTYAYMPPEQARGEVDRLDERSDVFGLGAILCEILTGLPPFTGSDGKDVFAKARKCDHAEAMARLDACGADAELLHLAKVCLATEPADRPRNAGVVAEEVKTYLAGVQELLQAAERERAAAEARAQEAKRTVAAERRTWRLTVWAAAAVLLITTVGFATTYWQYLETKNEGRQKDSALGKVKDALASETQAKQEAKQAQKEEKNAKAQAQKKEREAIRRLVQMHVATGVRLMEDGDHFGALPWLAAALAEERDPALRDMHRYRIGALLRQSPRLTRMFFHPVAYVQHVEFNPDGSKLLTNCDDHRARIWDVAAGKEVCSLPHIRTKTAPSAAMFSPDGHRVLTVSDDKTVRIVAAATGETIRTITAPEGVDWACFSPNGQRLLVVSAGRSGRVWDVQTGETVTPQLEHTDQIVHASFSPDGRWIATASKDATARVWDAATGKAIAPPLKHTQAVNWAAFSPDGKSVATVSIDGTLRVWGVNPDTAQLLWEAADGGSAHEVRFSPDGSRLVSCVYLRAELRDAKTGARIGQLHHNGAVYNTAFSPDGQRVATTSEDMTARVWDAATAAPLTPPLKHAYVVLGVAFSPDGRSLATGCHDGTARVWDLDGSSPLLSWASPHKLQALSPNTRYALALGALDRSVHLLDSGTGKEVRPPWQSAAAIGYVSFSPDSRLVVVCAGETARLWAIASGKETCPPLKHDGEVLIATINPDATRMATGCKDGAVHVWDLSTGKEVYPPLRHADSVYSIRFSADGRRLLTASEDSKARVWDTATGQPIGPFITHGILDIDTRGLRNVGGPAWSPDGSCLATEILGFTARAWDAATGQPVGSPLDHSGGLASLMFSPDGRRLLSTSNDCTAVQWDVVTGKRLTPAMRHRDFVRQGSYSPDGRLIATVADATLRLWDAATGLPLAPPLKLSHGGHLLWLQFAPGSRLFHWNGHINSMSVWDTSRDDRPVEDLVKLANLLAGHRLDDNGGLASLTRDELRKTWQDLLTKYPDGLAAPVEKKALLDWHFQQAEKAKKSNRPSLVISHWTRALELGAKDLGPDDGHDGCMLRASAYIQAKRWDKAAVDFMRTVAQQPEDHWGWFRAALLLLQAGDVKGYQRHRRDMLQRFGSTRDPKIAERVAKACLLLPAKPEEQNQAARLAERAVRDGAKHPFRPWFEFAKGLADYRQGQFARAEQRLRSLLASVGPEMWPLYVQGHLVLAMTQQRLDQSSKAHDSLNRAVQLQDQPALALDADNWVDWLICQILRREAEETLKENE